MKPTPPGWPRLSSVLFSHDARAAIAWYQRAFGFEVQILVDAPDGGVQHSELRYGDALVMVSDQGGDRDARFGVQGRAPAAVQGVNTQSLFVYVDEVDAHHDRALAAGARVTAPLADHDYGPEHWQDRGYACVDPDGHLWWFAQRLRNPAA